MDIEKALYRRNKTLTSSQRPLAMLHDWSSRLPQSLVACLASCLLLSCNAQPFPTPKSVRPQARAYSALAEPDLSSLVALHDPERNLDFTDPTSLLSRILIPRAAESANLTLVQNLFKQRFADLHKASSRDSWRVIEDTFVADTPYGPKQFNNLVFTHNPEAAMKFVLAAHTDSKYFPSAPMNGFVGATDSAAPCAILVDVAEALSEWLDEREEQYDREDEVAVTQGRPKRTRTTLSIVLLDGEEAFKDWTNTDSIYGAK